MYAEHAPGVWVCPFDRAEVDEVVARAGGTARHGVAVSLEPVPVGAVVRPATAYGVAGAGRRPPGGTEVSGDEDEAAFAARFRLVHEWRKFLFDDPGLRRRLCRATGPAYWRRLSTSEAERLTPGDRRPLSDGLTRRAPGM